MFAAPQVSHWGRVYVEERYRLRNAGTRVRHPFSRWQLVEASMGGRTRESPHVMSIPLTLPGAAQYVYTKDDLGNTQFESRVRRNCSKLQRSVVWDA